MPNNDQTIRLYESTYRVEEGGDALSDKEVALKKLRGELANMHAYSARAHTLSKKAWEEDTEEAHNAASSAHWDAAALAKHYKYNVPRSVATHHDEHGRVHSQRSRLKRESS